MFTGAGFRTYRGEDIPFVQPQIIAREQFLDAMEIAFELAALENSAAADASVSVLHEIPRLLA